MSAMTENHDALVLYMAILWGKEKEIAWKPKRFNAALNWLTEKGIMASAVAVSYERPIAEKSNGRNTTRSPRVRDKLPV
jgi:hypothetical protein